MRWEKEVKMEVEDKRDAEKARLNISRQMIWQPFSTNHHQRKRRATQEIIKSKMMREENVRMLQPPERLGGGGSNQTRKPNKGGKTKIWYGP